MQYFVSIGPKIDALVDVKNQRTVAIGCHSACVKVEFYSSFTNFAESFSANSSKTTQGTAMQFCSM